MKEPFIERTKDGKCTLTNEAVESLIEKFANGRSKRSPSDPSFTEEEASQLINNASFYFLQVEMLKLVLSGHLWIDWDGTDHIIVNP